MSLFVTCVETCDQTTALAALMAKRKQQEAVVTAGELWCDNYHRKHLVQAAVCACPPVSNWFKSCY